MLVSPKYRTLHSVMAAAHLNMNFELTDEVKAFIETYGLSDQILKPNEQYAKLKPEVATELLRVNKLFLTDNQQMEVRFKTIKEAVENDIWFVIERMAPQYKDFAKVTVTTYSEQKDDLHIADVYVTLGIATGEEDLSSEGNLESMHYVSNTSELLNDVARSYKWAAWLGVAESPFFDESFEAAYAEDQASIALEQFYATRAEGSYQQEIEGLVQTMLGQSKPVFYYIVNLDERGVFFAHVESEAGEEIMRIQNNEETGAIDLVEDGFIRGVDDLNGLRQYLVEVGLVPSNALLKKGR